MKSVKFVAVALVVLALAACNIGMGSQGVPGSDAEPLPEDIVRDVARSTGGEFTFETVIPVALNVEVNLYSLNDFGLVAGPTEHLPGQNTYVFVDDSQGKRVFSAQADEDGRVEATVVLPAAPEDMTMTVLAEGFGERTLRIRDMVALQAVDRVFSMGRFQEYESSYLARQLTGLEDTDGDGVPDAYDAFPYDFGSAFESTVPADGKLTIAFEDLFGVAGAGDADYNDFVAAFSITEALNTEGLVTRLTIDADAVDKIAGYDHAFGVRIDSFDGAATLSGTYVDEGGLAQGLEGEVTAPAEIVLFENSRYAVGKSATFTLEFSTPQQHVAPAVSGSGDAPVSRLSLPVAPYNPFAIVKNTGHDIHLIGREPLTKIVDSINPLDTFRDGDGYPWALLVPPVMVGNPPVAEGWDPPDETERIESDEWYPRFRNWRESGGERFTDWYLYFQQPYVPAEDAPAPLAGIDPQPLSGDPVVYPASRTYQLLTEEGTTPANYRSVDPLPEWITLTAGSGEVTVDSSAADPPLSAGEQRQATAEFYTSDNDYQADDDISGSTLNEPLSVTFAVERGEVVEEPGVYVAGYYNNGTRLVAAYWVDDGTSVTPVPLVTDALSQATGISVDQSGVVHASGWLNTASGQVAAYWRDGKKFDLDTGARATGIVLDSNGDAYISGFYNDGGKDIAVYWTVAGDTDIRHDLELVNRSSATGIDLDSLGTVYVSGYENYGSQDVAVYWTATGSDVDTKQLYTSGYSRSSAIIHDSGVTYVAGEFSDGVISGAYWVDDWSVKVTLDGSTGTPRSIARLGGQTIVAGDYVSGAQRTPAVWTTTDPTDLPTDPPGVPGNAYGILTSSDDVYAAGSQRASVEEAVYWKNGSLVVLEPDVQSRALAIAIGP